MLWELPRPRFYPMLKDEKHIQRYKLFVENIRELINSEQLKGYKHVFLPFFYEKDMDLFNTITEGLEADYVICGNEMGIDIDEKRLLSKYARVCVCMRFHGAMFALYHSKPSLVISYSHKASDVLKEYNLDKYLTEYGMLDNECFYRAFDLNMPEVYRALDNALSNTSGEDFKQVSQALKAQAAEGERLLINWLKGAE